MKDQHSSGTMGHKAAGAASSAEIADAFEDFMMAFEAFKETNDGRFDEIEKHMSADVLTREKLDRINKSVEEHKLIVDELVLKAARPNRDRLGPTSAR